MGLAKTDEDKMIIRNLALAVKQFVNEEREKAKNKALKEETVQVERKGKMRVQPSKIIDMLEPFLPSED